MWQLRYASVFLGLDFGSILPSGRDNSIVGAAAVLDMISGLTKLRAPSSKSVIGIAHDYQCMVSLMLELWIASVEEHFCT